MAVDDTSTQQAAQEVARLEDERYDAIVAGDLESFAALCHQDLVYSHSDGSRDTLSSYLEKVRSGFYAYHRIDHPVAEIVVKGDVALVIGRMDADITAGGNQKSLANNALAVWLRESGRWQLLAYQPTPAPVV